MKRQAEILKELSSVTRDMAGFLRALRNRGIESLPGDPAAAAVEKKPAPSASAPPRPQPQGPLQPPRGGPEGRPPLAPAPAIQIPVTDLGKQASLDYIAEQALTCKRCRLGDSRTRVVFGDGNANARIVFVGEGPGAHEDACGLPFVGKAGQLLTKMLAAIGIARQDVYITNIVKCRPPNNREPQVDEIAACRPFLNAQLEVIAPSVLVSLGRPSAQTLLADTRSLTELRRMKHKYGDIDMLVTYHPAFLLRNPSKKRGSWADLLALARLMTRKGLRAEEAEPWWR